ncbi:hypothetical protein WJ542_20165 [Paraburkholderia sp. B3]
MTTPAEDPALRHWGRLAIPPAQPESNFSTHIVADKNGPIAENEMVGETS